ncbi:MAG: putative toxin-antitoxin system toxin component, PIN family [Kiritimatiellae bacterium]|nr:putative toxin-antitoxin system toxin component, PIN family [Kiritimatiellia bacterium]
MVTQAEMNASRVVLDTNVVLSALLFKSGRVCWLIPLWQFGRITPLVSNATACELIRVLKYPKFKLTTDEQTAVLSAFLPYAETVAVQGLAALPACRDPADDMFLALAAQGCADYLVTGDVGLLAVRGFKTCPIINPEQFRKGFY